VNLRKNGESGGTENAGVKNHSSRKGLYKGGGSIPVQRDERWGKGREWGRPFY